MGIFKKIGLEYVLKPRAGLQDPITMKNTTHADKCGKCLDVYTQASKMKFFWRETNDH